VTTATARGSLANERKQVKSKKAKQQKIRHQDRKKEKMM
jgi:hypothetical protein